MKLITIPIYFDSEDDKINKLIGKESTFADAITKPIDFAKIFDAIREDEEDGISFTRLYYGDTAYSTPWSKQKCIQEFDKLVNESETQEYLDALKITRDKFINSLISKDKL